MNFVGVVIICCICVGNHLYHHAPLLPNGKWGACSVIYDTQATQPDPHAAHYKSGWLSSNIQQTQRFLGRCAQIEQLQAGGVVAEECRSQWLAKSPSKELWMQHALLNNGCL